MKSVTGTWFARLLAALATAVFRYPKLIFFPQLLLAGLCVFYTVKYLQFDPSQDNLVGANKRYHRNFLQFEKEFPDQNDLVVVVESESPEKNRQFVERLGAKLEAETNLFKNVFYKGDLKMMGDKALLFVPDKADARFAAGDFKDLPAFAAKVNQPSNAVSAYLHAQLSAATREALTSFPRATTNPIPLLSALTNDLNRVVTGPSIFQAQRFRGVTLRPETQRLLTQNLDATNQARLNRGLLEDAYPAEIARSDLEELLLALQTYQPFIQQFTHATNLVSLFSLVNTQFRTAKREENAETASLVKALPALERIIREADDSLRRPGTPPSPGINALFGAGQEAEQQMYITYTNASGQGQIYLVTAQAPTDELNAAAVHRLRQLVAATRAEVPGLNVGITGQPVLDEDQMRQSQHDASLASVVSLVLCALIFVYGYNEIGRPIKATFGLLIGLAYAMGFATLVIGHLNILTITFAPILIGLAIDFAVHLITRYEEELRRGETEREAMTKAMVFTGQGIVTSGMTTGGAFLAMGLTDFKGIQEMGIICGGGLLLCLIPMMTLLPVLLLRGRQNVIDHETGDPFAQRARIERLWLDRPVTVVIVVLLLCGLAVSQFRNIWFDYDLREMQSKGLPAVVFEKKLIEAGGRSVLFAAVIADTLAEAQEIEEKVRQLPTVADVESMSHYLNEDQTHKLRLIGQVKKEVAPLRFEDYDRAPVAVEPLSATLYYLQGYCAAAADEARKEDPEVARQLLSLRDVINQFRKDMLAAPQVAAEKVAAFQQALFQDVHDTFAALAHQDDSGPLRVQDLPPAMRNRFVGVTGKFLLQVYPKEDVWKRENQREFINELRHALTPNEVPEHSTPGLFHLFQRLAARLTGQPMADPAPAAKPIITGIPVQFYEYTGLLVNSYIEAAWYSLGAIVILVLFHFRTLTSVVLALIPVAVGTIWLGGIMGGCNLQLNPANIMTLPLVIGIGVTNGIQILNRFAEERVPGVLAKSTGKAVLVSGLTAIAGFGSLILGKHQGIHSLGLVMSIGIATCMIAGLTFLPAVMSLMARLGVGTKRPSADNA